MRNVFELGYRRYEWKCDALNAPSIAAAERLGFTFEGVFRQATIFRGRSRGHRVVRDHRPGLGRAEDRLPVPSGPSWSLIQPYKGQGQIALRGGTGLG